MNVRRWIAVVAASVIVSAMGVSGASADGEVGQTEADDTAGLIADLAPVSGDLAPGSETAAGVVSETDGASVVVPAEPQDTVTLKADLGVGEDVAVSVALPAELSLGEAEVAGDGTVVYAAEGGDSVAVQVFQDGVTRIQSVSVDADSPNRFTYELGANVVLVPAEDGSVLLTVPQEDDTLLLAGSVAAPWAVDAQGQAVSTYYEVDGSSLVQVVQTTEETTFPVVADPSIEVGTFTQHGDYVHVTSGQASGHGWWTAGPKVPSGTGAVVTIYLQYNRGSGWVDATKPVARTLRPGSAKRANARYTCNGSSAIAWRSVVDVDLIGLIDDPTKLVTPSQRLSCGA